MMSYLKVLLAVLFSAAGGGAMAEDLDPAAAGRMSFDGAYVGLQAGFGSFRSGFSSNFDLLSDGRRTDTGGSAGILGGYGRSFDRFYLGIEGELQSFAGSADVEASSHSRWGYGAIGGCPGLIGSVIGATNGCGRRYVSEARTEWFRQEIREMASLEARFGYELPGIMPFASVGLAAGRIDTSYLFTSERNFFRDTVLISSDLTQASADDTEFGFGYTLGGGVEVPIGEGFSVRGEYGFTNLGERRYEFEFEDGAIGKASFDTKMHQGKLGFSYRF